MSSFRKSTSSSTSSSSSSASLSRVAAVLPTHSATTSTSPRDQLIGHDESDAECWERMLSLQMEYHCFKSARLEAAVEAKINGVATDEIQRPSRFCLDLLNDELRASLQDENEYRGRGGL